jgi:hypothetical protein
MRRWSLGLALLTRPYAGKRAARALVAAARFCGPSLLMVWLGLGCTSLGDDVRRAELAFSEARYEDVEEWLGDLESDLGKMSTPLRARYYYLAGMSAYRIGQRSEARHALALCREELATSTEQLPPAWMHNLETALAEL